MGRVLFSLYIFTFTSSIINILWIYIRDDVKKVVVFEWCKPQYGERERGFGAGPLFVFPSLDPEVFKTSKGISAVRYLDF